jgi:hypothetical protein
MVGYVPRGIARLSGGWRAPVPDYSVPGLPPALGYLLSGALGIAVVAGITLLVGRLLGRRNHDRRETEGHDQAS